MRRGRPSVKDAVHRTLTHSKRVKYLQFHIDFEDAVYNFVRPHGSLRLRLRSPEPHGRLWVARSPAMAAGLTDHIWSMEELMSWCPPPPG